MKFLVTGGAGYLGSVVVGRLIDAGHFVRVLDTLMFGGEHLLPYYGNENFEFIRGDIRDRDTVSKSLKDVNAVAHLAAMVGAPLCSKHPTLAKQINEKATLTLVDLCQKAEISRFIFASTCSVYGISSGVADEESPTITTSIYAETKVASEDYVLTKRDQNFHPLILRFATLYGLSPRGSPDAQNRRSVAHL